MEEKDEEADWLQIPSRLVTTVEHPGIINTANAAVATLGGQARVDKFMSSVGSVPPDRFLGLSLEPSDEFRPALPTQVAWTSNIVLKISVPRRIGRKRKRLHDQAENAQHDAEHHPVSEAPDKGAEYLLRSLRDNDEDYDIEPIGFSQDTCRFRGNLDYQFSMSTSNLSERMKSSILPFKYKRTKQFSLDTATRGTVDEADIIPPPRLLNMAVPHHYMYLQNPYSEIDHTGQSMKNNFTPMKWYHQKLNFRQGPVPTTPMSELPPESKLSRPVKDLIRRLRELFNKRPITTRRVLYNTFESAQKQQLERALEYCAYQFRSGPWRDCVIKLGVEPRGDPQYRIYQTFTFQGSTSMRKGGGQPSTAAYTKYGASSSHVFDGHTYSAEVKMFAVCDIHDALVQRVISAPPRASCEISREGWFQNGTWAKIKIIMHEKLRALSEGHRIPDSYFDSLLEFPDSCNDLHETDAFKPSHGESHTLFTQFRNEMRVSFAPKHVEDVEALGDEDEDQAIGEIDPPPEDNLKA